MKRLKATINGVSVTPEEIRERVGAVSHDWLKAQRPAKARAPKRRMSLTPQQKADKAAATAQAKLRREDERLTREHDLVQRCIKYLRNRSEREAADMLRVRIEYRKGREPKIGTICSKALYTRLRPEVLNRSPKSPSRKAADGFKNIVLRKTSRGHGRKAEGSRDYRAGEAADLVRYILRPDALEAGIEATFSNVVGAEFDEPEDELKQVAQAVAFFDALENFEKAVSDEPNVYSHLILAMPHELSPEMRSEALEDFCMRLDGMNLPYVAALHAPDPQGDQRNFHAHIMVGFRPFEIEGEFAWSLEARKFSEFNLSPMLPWFRQQAAEAFNAALAQENKEVRYTGVSEADRGLEGTGERHKGPVATARERKINGLIDTKHGILKEIARHVVDKIRKNEALGRLIAAQAPAQRASAPSAQPEMSPAIAAVARKYPDPKALKKLTVMDFQGYTPADFEADRWFAPAWRLRSKLGRDPHGMVRDRDGIPEVVGEKLDETERELLAAGSLPDIVDEALREAHRQVLLREKSLARKERETNELRRETLKWLRNHDVPIFDDNYNTVPEIRERLPEFVKDMRGVREAMHQSHLRWLQTREELSVGDKPEGAPPAPAPAPKHQVQVAPAEDAWEELQRLNHIAKGRGQSKG